MFIVQALSPQVTPLPLYEVIAVVATFTMNAIEMLTVVSLFGVAFWHFVKKQHRISRELLQAAFLFLGMLVLGLGFSVFIAKNVSLSERSEAMIANGLVLTLTYVGVSYLLRNTKSYRLLQKIFTFNALVLGVLVPALFMLALWLGY